MRRTVHIAFVLMLPMLCASLLHAKEEPLDKLVQRAQNENDPKLLARVVDRYADLAHDLYGQGDSATAIADANEAVAFAVKSRDAANAHTNKIKDAEILLRKAQRTLQELARAADLDDRPPLEQAAAQISRLRDDMLNVMFGK